MNITQDKFWGYVLIGLGIAALAFHPFDKVNSVLTGSSDRVLTLACIALGIGVITLGLVGKPATKALAVFWVVTP